MRIFQGPSISTAVDSPSSLGFDRKHGKIMKSGFLDTIDSPPVSPPQGAHAKHIKESTAELRAASGMCPSCGQQLYRWQKNPSDQQQGFSLATIFHNKNDNSKSQRRIPLTIPQLVDRGQCLICRDRKNTACNTDSPIPTTIFASTSQQQPLPPTGTAVYHGEYNAQGQRHGHGEMVWSNGDVYRGEFQNDNRHGHGELTFHNEGGEYVGSWRHDDMHGQGTRRFPNGDIYIGDYHQNVRTGQGRFYYTNGDMYWGSWKNNQMHGPGRYYYASGQRFEGTFVHAKRTGKGKLQRTDGSLDVFQYVNDQRVGQGVRWSADRSKAWRLWCDNSRTAMAGATTIGNLQKQKITLADAAGLVYDIEQASLSTLEDYVWA